MLPRTTKATLLFLGTCLLLMNLTFGKETEKAPRNIIEHYRWCTAPKSRAERLARFQRFWAQYAPDGTHEYEDAIHVRFVHLCAYRLAELYAETGNVRKCREILAWLENEDHFIK